MKIERIDFTSDGSVYLDAYLPDKSPEMPHLDVRPAMMICPGGGYSFVSDREGEPVAFHFLAAGYTCFVLHYSIKGQSAFPHSLVDLMRAMAHVRRGAAHFAIDADKIGVIGFSAGGHLAASLGVFWQDGEILKSAGVSAEEARPNALLLIYPVIDVAHRTHSGTAQNLAQGTPDDAKCALFEKLSLQNQVRDQVPPTFLFSTFYDNAVPVESSLWFAEALLASEIPFEMHIAQDGVHGLALADRVTARTPDGLNEGVSEWPRLAVRWLDNLFAMRTMAPRVYPPAYERKRPYKFKTE